MRYIWTDAERGSPEDRHWNGFAEELDFVCLAVLVTVQPLVCQDNLFSQRFTIIYKIWTFVVNYVTVSFYLKRFRFVVASHNVNVDNGSGFI